MFLCISKGSQKVKNGWMINYPTPFWMENFLLCIVPLSEIFFWQDGDESQLINDCFSRDIKNIWKWFFVQLTQLQLLICSVRGKEMKQNTQLMIIRNQGHLLLSQGRCLLFRWIVKSSRDMESDLFDAFVWGPGTYFVRLHNQELEND